MYGHIYIYVYIIYIYIFISLECKRPSPKSGAWGLASSRKSQWTPLICPAVLLHRWAARIPRRLLVMSLIMVVDFSRFGFTLERQDFWRNVAECHSPIGTDTAASSPCRISVVSSCGLLLAPGVLALSLCQYTVTSTALCQYTITLKDPAAQSHLSPSP